jgi:DNA mismatch endonuclease, patch repair protein
MSRVAAKNTAPEIYVRKALHAAGLRFRLHRRDLPGSPDIVLPKYGVVVLVHGCFWHSHDCVRGARPRSNVDFWTSKLDRNRERDQTNRQQLEALGWKVQTIWECTLDKGVQQILAHVQASTGPITSAR